MDPIQFIGTKKLDEFEKELVNKLANEYYQKIARSIKNVTSVILDLKLYDKAGRRQKYSLHVRVEGPFKTIEASAVDWDLARVVHEAFNAVEKEIQHRFHTDTPVDRKEIIKREKKRGEK